MKKGTIVSHFGVAVLVEDEKQARTMIRVKRDSEYVVGDIVFFDERVVQILPRINVLSRRVNTSIQKAAANLDALGIVVAPTPQTPRTFIDLAIISARVQGIDPILIANKSDLASFSPFKDELNADFGKEIPIFVTSTKKPSGISELDETLNQKGQTMLIGVSGTGKSSLVNALVPKAMLEIGELAPKDKHGKHMTTASTLHHLSKGGTLIDSPGVRDFKLSSAEPKQIAENFVGFSEALRTPCRFRDCLHSTEPGCSIKDGVREGRISKSRYAIYLELIAEARTEKPPSW